MKTIRETERTLTLTDEKGGYQVISPDYSETYGSLSLQEGPIKETGVNGCQVEDLLAICIHRLEGFQSGKLACEEGKYALMNVHQSITFLNSRTLDRKKRGVEGTNKK